MTIQYDIVEGIGSVLEHGLYATGICTCDVLADTTEQLLEQICQAPAFQRPNYKY